MLKINNDLLSGELSPTNIIKNNLVLLGKTSLLQIARGYDAANVVDGLLMYIDKNGEKLSPLVKASIATRILAFSAYKVNKNSIKYFLDNVGYKAIDDITKDFGVKLVTSLSPVALNNLLLKDSLNKGEELFITTQALYTFLIIGVMSIVDPVSMHGFIESSNNKESVDEFITLVSTHDRIFKLSGALYEINRMIINITGQGVIKSDDKIGDLLLKLGKVCSDNLPMSVTNDDSSFKSILSISDSDKPAEVSRIISGFIEDSGNTPLVCARLLEDTLLSNSGVVKNIREVKFLKTRFEKPFDKCTPIKSDWFKMVKSGLERGNDSDFCLNGYLNRISTMLDARKVYLEDTSDIINRLRFLQQSVDLLVYKNNLNNKVPALHSHGIDTKNKTYKDVLDEVKSAVEYIDARLVEFYFSTGYKASEAGDILKRACLTTEFDPSVGFGFLGGSITGLLDAAFLGKYPLVVIDNEAIIALAKNQLNNPETSKGVTIKTMIALSGIIDTQDDKDSVLASTSVSNREGTFNVASISPRKEGNSLTLAADKETRDLANEEFEKMSLLNKIKFVFGV